MVGEFLEAVPSGAEQLWERSEIPISTSRFRMAHVDREVRQQVIDRQTTVVPLKHAAHRKCVPQPMNARPGVAATVLNTGHMRQADKVFRTAL